MVPDTYLNEAPPPPMNDDMFADIYLSINVIEVLDLSEVDAAMVLQYRMTLRWRDSRVKFRNLKKENFLNTVGREDAAKIWYPQLTFYNTKDMEETKVTNKYCSSCKTFITLFLLQYNDKSVITIQRNGTATISPLKALQNDHIYSGVENELILSQVYTTSFTCKYDMGSYPFDTQRCSMVFIMQVSMAECCYAY